MIRFTVIDRLLRIVVAALSPKECVYMMYVLGIRNGVYPVSVYYVPPNDPSAEQSLRAKDVMLGVTENVFELPEAEREFVIQATTLSRGSLNLASVSVENTFSVFSRNVEQEEEDSPHEPASVYVTTDTFPQVPATQRSLYDAEATRASTEWTSSADYERFMILLRTARARAEMRSYLTGSAAVAVADPAPGELDGWPDVRPNPTPSPADEVPEPAPQRPVSSPPTLSVGYTSGGHPYVRLNETDYNSRRR